VTDKTGVAIGEYVYRPFGETYFESGTHFRYLYTGQEQDFETGLYFYNARYYDARLARFIQPDTIVPGAFDPQALNRYSYVGNSPIVYTDPTGHFSLRDVFRVVEIVVGAVIVAGGGPLAGFGAALIAHGAEGLGANVSGGGGAGVSCTANGCQPVAIDSNSDFIPPPSQTGGGIVLPNPDPGAVVDQSFTSLSPEAGGPPSVLPPNNLFAGPGAPLLTVNYNGQVVRNPHVRDELAKLRAGLDVEGHSNIDLVVTGGESYYDAAAGRSISLTDGSVIPKRGSGSAHHIEYGARDVDVRRVGIPDADFKSVVRTYTNFDRMGNDYSDGHWHLGLPHTYNCPPGVCRR